MTAVYLTCDRCRAELPLTGQIVNVEQQRQAAGWVRQEGKDECAACVEKEKAA